MTGSNATEKPCVGGRERKGKGGEGKGGKGRRGEGIHIVQDLGERSLKFCEGRLKSS